MEGEAEDDDVTTNTQEGIQEIQSNSHTNTRRNKVATREIETFQARLGYVPVKDLLLGSEAQIWRDTRFRLSPNGVFNTVELHIQYYETYVIQYSESA